MSRAGYVRQWRRDNPEGAERERQASRRWKEQHPTEIRAYRERYEREAWARKQRLAAQERVEQVRRQWWEGRVEV